MEDEELFIRLEVEELLKRYVAGEREFRFVDLSGDDLSGVDFGRRTLRGVVYNRQIELSPANLSGANLSGANLRNAIMGFVNLSNACLEGANLESAYLEGANLRGTNLRGTNLGGTNLAGADLTDADLRGATVGFNVKDTIFNNTILPDGTVRNEPYSY